MDAVFLGANDVGERIYEWLCDRDGVRVRALLTEKDQLELVRTITPDIVISVGFRHIVPSDVLDIPDQGCINLHPAYLPYNRGANPNVWSIVDGTPAGVTMHYMDKGIDTGDIIARQRVKQHRDDTGKDLHHRLERAQYDLFVKTWPDIESGGVEAISQNESEGTFHREQEFENLCEFNLDDEYTVREFVDRLRALTYPPYDNAYIDIKGERYHIDLDIRRDAGAAPDGDKRGF